jgi:hypothetical protein
MASASYELLPWAVLSLSLLHEEIHGSLHVFHIQRSALSDQFLDVEIPEPSRPRVIRNIQRIYMRAWPVRSVDKDSVWGAVHPCNAYAARAGAKAVGNWPWGPPCMTVTKGCALRRFGSIRIDSTGYRSGMGSTAALRSRRTFSTN